MIAKHPPPELTALVMVFFFAQIVALAGATWFTYQNTEPEATTTNAPALSAKQLMLYYIGMKNLLFIIFNIPGLLMVFLSLSSTMQQAWFSVLITLQTFFSSSVNGFVLSGKMQILKGGTIEDVRNNKLGKAMCIVLIYQKP